MTCKITTGACSTTTAIKNNAMKSLNALANLDFSLEQEKELKSYGFDCSRRSLKTANKRLFEHNDHIVIDTDHRIDQENYDRTISDDAKQEIREWYHKHSRPAPNVILIKESIKQGCYVVKRYLTASKRRLWVTFPNHHKKQLEAKI